MEDSSNHDVSGMDKGSFPVFKERIINPVVELVFASRKVVESKGEGGFSHNRTTKPVGNQVIGQGVQR